MAFAFYTLLKHDSFSNIKENDVGKYKYTIKCSKKNYFGYKLFT